jgi:DNA-nicking Smr family endonuclease
VTNKKDLSKEDKDTWQDYIKNPSDVYDKDRSKSFTNKVKDRFKFDLHGYTLSGANTKVKELIISCIENNFREILLITGKGIHSTNEKDIYVSKDLGKLKFSVPEYINSDEELSKYILSLEEANEKDGGEGAILIKLRNL